MALQKSITFPNGSSGNYIRVGAYYWDRNVGEASAQFMLHTSAVFDEPLCLIAVLRLNGAKFQEFLGTNALAEEGATVLGRLYLAAKSEPLIAGGGLNAIDLSEAEDV